MVREFATSKDGTRVPVNILRRKGVAARRQPSRRCSTATAATASARRPRFLAARAALWFDAGGVFAVANIRGGGEYGEEWHQPGMLTRKQNVFDDFVAAAELLVDASKYTTAGELAIQGG